MGNRRGVAVPGPEAGFTLVELLTVLVVLGILAAVVAPRLIGGAFETLGFADETRAVLRYARGSALAMQRTVCVGFTASSVTLTYASAYGAPACDTGLPAPSGTPVPYAISARGPAAFAPVPANFSYDRLGRPSAGQVISVSGAQAIRVEAETGYVY